MSVAKAFPFLFLWPAVAQAEAPVRLAPSGGWSLNYGESCDVTRAFGSGASESHLTIERVAPDEPMTMAVTGRPFAVRSPTSGISARFLPSAKVWTNSGGAGINASGLPAILWGGLSFLTAEDFDAMPAKERRARLKEIEAEMRGPINVRKLEEKRAEREANAAAVEAIAIDGVSGLDVVLETGSLGAVHAMLEQCANHQLKTWGIDPETERQIVKRPRPRNIEGWFSYSDYPPESFLRSQHSDLRVRALVDRRGQITSCTPLTFVGDPSYMRKVCDVMTKRARFDPAELADGRTVPSYHIQRIVFVH